MSEKLIIEMILEPRAEKNAFKKTEQIASKSGKKAGSEFSESFGKSLKNGMKSAAGSLAVLAIGAKVLQVFSSAMRDSVVNLAEFKKGIAEINSILPENGKMTEGATKRLQNFSAQFGSTQQKQARAFYNIVSAGVKGTAKQLKTLKVANKAAIAGLVDIDDSARVIVSSVNAYSKSALTASQASDALFVAVREGQTTFGELADSMGNVTSIAANAGVKFHELAGAVAFVTKSGIKTDIAVTGLRQVFASVIKPSSEAADEASRLGIEFNKAAIESKGLAGFLKDVQSKTKGNEASLAKLFGNIRALAPILNIVNGNFSDFKRILDETEGSLGATGKAAEGMKDTLSFDFKTMSSELAVFGTNVASLVEGPLRYFVNSIKTIAHEANRAFGENAVTPLDKLRKRLKENKQEAKNLNNAIATFRARHDYAKEREALAELKAIQIEERALRRRHRNMMVEREKEATQKIIDGRNAAAADEAAKAQKSLDNLGNLGLTKIQILQQQKDKALALLNEELMVKTQQEGEYLARKAVLEAQFSEQIAAEEQKRIANNQGFWDAMKNQAAKGIDDQKKDLKELGQAIESTFKTGLGNAFEDAGRAMANHASEWDAFLAGVNQVVGEVASLVGDMFIKWGLGYIATGNYVMGAAVMAAGIGMKMLGGFAKQTSSNNTASSSSGGGGGGGGSPSIDRGVENQELERQTTSVINVNVEGSLVQQEELGSFLSKVQSESNEKNGNVILNPRFA